MKNIKKIGLLLLSSFSLFSCSNNAKNDLVDLNYDPFSNENNVIEVFKNELAFDSSTVKVGEAYVQSASDEDANGYNYLRFAFPIYLSDLEAISFTRSVTGYSDSIISIEKVYKSISKGSDESKTYYYYNTEEGLVSDESKATEGYYFACYTAKINKSLSNLEFTIKPTLTIGSTKYENFYQCSAKYEIVSSENKAKINFYDGNNLLINSKIVATGVPTSNISDDVWYTESNTVYDFSANVTGNLSLYKRTISFTPGYATGDLIQVNTGIKLTDEKPSGNFLIGDFPISHYGTATVAWVTVNDNSIWTFNFSSSSVGQFIVIEKGSKFTMATGHIYTLDANYMFVRGETAWSGRKMLDNELAFKMVTWSASTVNQVLTNSTLDAKGADTSGGGNGIINLKHSNDTVLWGYYGNGIHSTYNTMYMSFTFNTECPDGSIMAIDKETTLVLSDDSVVEVGVNYKFTYTSGSWVMKVSI